MPNINRIRVNNVKYNFGTQSYDDFIMKPFGHNTLYDLANGGGKSVLMLLMLQNVLPNCTLDDKQPVEKLFRTNEGSQTIHSLIEWNLDQRDIHNGFRYMTTGFCARKAGTHSEAAPAEAVIKDTASIEYFNYCIFYREYNANDIRNLPLVKNKERITYGGLKKYLKELERDNSLIVKVFDRKGEYQNFISNYGLYESQWEIIRGINKTEGHVRAYFESNYKTTRKVVEDLLIEEIIEKSLRLRSEGEESTDLMSQTLLNIKDRLLELSKKKEELVHYDRQMELLRGFSERIMGILKLFENLTLCETELRKVYTGIKGLYEAKSEAYETGKLEVLACKEQIYTLTREIEGARYYMDKTEAGDILERLKSIEEESTELNKRIEELRQALSLKESFNDYLEYQEEKRKKEETEEAIAAIKNKGTGLIDEIHCLTYHLKHRLEKQQKRQMEELRHAEAEKKTLKEQEQGLDQKVRRIEQENAVSESRHTEAEERMLTLGSKIKELKSRLGMLVAEQAEEVLTQATARLAKLKEGKSVQDLRKMELESRIGSVNVTFAKQEIEKNRGQELIHQQESLLKQFESEKKRINTLGEVYGEKDFYLLKQAIKDRYKNNIKNIEEKESDKKSLEFDIKRMQERTFLTNRELLLEVREYIKVRQNTIALTGEEYLASLEEEERLPLLKSYPFLPYSLVLKEGYETIRLDSDIFGRLPAEAILPILEERGLKLKKTLLNCEYIHLLSRDQTIIYDEERLEKEIYKKQRELTECANKLSRLKDQEITYMEDQDYVERFLLMYEEKYIGLNEELIKRREADQELSDSLRCLKEELEGLQNEKRALLEQMKKDEEEVLSLEEDIASLKELSGYYAESRMVEQTIVETEKRCEAFSNQLKLMKAEQEEISLKLRSLEGICEAKRSELKQLQDNWVNKYQAYYQEGNYPELEITDEELMAQLNGKCQAFQSEHTDIEDKNRLIHSYVNGMNRCLKSISNRNINLAMLGQLQKEGSLYPVNEQELSMLKQELIKLQKESLIKEKELEEKKASFNRLDGKSGQALSAFEEKYGQMQEAMFDGVNPVELIESNRQQILKNEHKLSILERAQHQLESEQQQLLDMKKDMERSYKNTVILTESYAGGARVSKEIEENIRSLYEEQSANYERLFNQLKSKRDDFAKNKEKTMEALRALNAVGLAEEMRDSVSMPENAEDTMNLVNRLSEVNECLSLEKSRIERGIEDMQQMKESFENQCLQRCLHIRTELERLPKLSKIMLEGEQINMIQLSIPYVKEEFIKEKMSGYIDEIVRGADGLKEAGERLKYIRNALSLKKLFSVIVTDMNHIRLTLYKRERIREQSKHLRYEEAVGSTGQSQGIYIQFLIAIINYISSINSGLNYNSVLQNVIFIDNPFGAAKDVYIWEPIFELLKTNHVQLIVPARGTTPAITGRFDVNYVLGQKLIDKRQQTVVVDYQSRVDAKEVEYIPLQFEQESFDLFGEENLVQ